MASGKVDSGKVSDLLLNIVRGHQTYENLAHNVRDYKYLFLGYAYSRTMRGSIIIPVNLFVNPPQAYETGFGLDENLGGARVYCFFKYATDTSIQITGYQDDYSGGEAYFQLYGLK